MQETGGMNSLLIRYILDSEFASLCLQLIIVHR